ncbi:MAG: host attachment protein [Rhodocyclaceae bacterium]
MSTTWIVVANARTARIFANHGPNKGIELVTEKAAAPEIEVFDPLGRSDRRREPTRTATQGFAHTLARDLQMGRSRGDYKRAVLVAPPSFMGMLNSELDPPTASMVSNRLDKDYTKLQGRDLSMQLGQCLCV